MIGYSAPRFSIVITHEPTGIVVKRTSDHFRKERDAYNSAMKYLRSRLYMLGYAPSDIKEEHIEVSTNTSGN